MTYLKPSDLRLSSGLYVDVVGKITPILIQTVLCLGNQTFTKPDAKPRSLIYQLTFTTLFWPFCASQHRVISLMFHISFILTYELHHSQYNSMVSKVNYIVILEKWCV